MPGCPTRGHEGGHSHPLPCEDGRVVRFEAPVPDGHRRQSDGDAALGRNEGDRKEPVGCLVLVEPRVVLIDEALVQEGGSPGSPSLLQASPGRTFDQFESDEASQGTQKKHCYQLQG